MYSRGHGSLYRLMEKVNHRVVDNVAAMEKKRR